MLESRGEPIMSSTLLLPGDDIPLTDVYEIEERIGNDVDLILAGGSAGITPTTVVDLSSGTIDVLRVGLGAVSALE
jgi:tRNA A37 threonylcarbamoyladenosine synthetase subunit TsaC/SUA5/YrdC